MVRSCAFGALGHLRAKKAKNEIHTGIFDENNEVKKKCCICIVFDRRKII